MFRRVVNIIALVVVAASAGSIASRGAEDIAPADHFVGRWDIRVDDPGGAYPSWLEIQKRDDGKLSARFVGRVGRARAVTRLTVEDREIAFSLPAEFEARDEDLRFAGELDGGTLRGVTTNDVGERVTWTAVRAPTLQRGKEFQWGRSHTMLGADGLEGWRSRRGDDTDCWKVAEGVLSSDGPCTDLVSERRFRDFRLTLEFMLPPGGDSGVHLRGRYEIQLKDDSGGVSEPANGVSGSLYGFLPPLKAAGGKPGEWQTLEATLIGRTLTVVLNGETVIDAQEVPGITGDALDSDEDVAGPIMLQGYLGGVSYRNIVVTPAMADL
jgi:hypothetical protein